MTVLVAAGMLGLLALGASQVLTNLGSGVRRAELRSELETIRSLIFEHVDCAKTFAVVGIDPASPGTSCNSTSTTQTGPYLRLARKTANGTTQYLTPPLATDGTAKLGAWTIRVSCSAADQSLIIRAARPLEGGGFARDPQYRDEGTETVVGGKKWDGYYDWKAPRSLLFGGGAGAMPLCFNSPGGLDCVTNTSTVEEDVPGQPTSNYSRRVRASCGASYKLVGGGCNAWFYNGGYGTGGGAAAKSYPSGNDWICDKVWGDAAPSTAPPEARAICCR